MTAEFEECWEPTAIECKCEDVGECDRSDAPVESVAFAIFDEGSNSMAIFFWNEHTTCHTYNVGDLCLGSSLRPAAGQST